MTAPTRSCIGVAVPPGPDGLAAVLAALPGALDGSGPALALLPAAGAGPYRARIAAAVRPGEPVPAGVALVLATSGSTSDPAGVLLPGRSLLAAAAGMATALGSAGGHAWVAALPLHHAGGVLVAVRAVAAGAPIVPTATLGGAGRFTPEVFAAATLEARTAATGHPLAVSVVPAMLSLLVDSSTGAAALRTYDLVLVGGSATPAPLLDRARAAGVRVRTSYGMTETAGGCVLDGIPLPGTSVDVHGGALRVRGAQVGAGYRDGRQPDRWGVLEGQPAFTTDDLGSVGPGGVVQVRGRRDDVVAVSGASVSLAAVRAALVADPAVADAAAVALPDPRWGARVVALVVPAAGTAPDVEALAETVVTRLGGPARPRPVALVEALPQLDSGKPDRQALTRMAHDLGRIHP